ncbi:MAG: FAD-dependent oxidoreductase, partial [Anaerolineaceae bacterium]|nr:FAD-dependent oxidoreductase [Anaerolineaceae bacterium]
LIFPFYDKLIVGTSDLPIENADDARCTPEEELYFIELVSRVFPDIKVTPAHIVFRFTGVRPLEYSKAKTTAQISRDHTIQIDKVASIPVYSLVGGKWTTFRAFAEQITDRTLTFLGKTRKADTKTTPIGGGRDYPKTDSARSEWLKKIADEGKISATAAANLFDRYGTRGLEVARYLAAGSDAPLKARPEYSRREMEFLVQHESAVHVDDLLLRRTTLGWLGFASRPLVEELAEITGNVLGWNAEERQAEIDRTIALLKDMNGVEL